MCACCGRDEQGGELYCRGLCRPCYSRMGRHEREAYPRVRKAVPQTGIRSRTREEVLEDWEILRKRGMSKREASVAMGYKRKTLERVIIRARVARERG